MQTVTSADGTPIAFEQTGSGPPLVLVYGNGDVHETWEVGGVRPALAEAFTVYAIERRGRRESGDAAEYALEREAEDVAAVAGAIDEPVTLLGHSGGALYSLEAALRSDNLRNLILYEPPIGVSDHDLEVEEGIAAMNRLLDGGKNEQAFLLFLQEVAQLTQEEIEELRATPVWEHMVSAADVLPRELEAIATYNFEPRRFEEMTTPTLLLSGSESAALYQEATNRVGDALPNAQTVIFEGQAHEAMHTAPERFVDEVVAFAGQRR
ncbi:MAG: alpha/beta hydrolase [Candidatus Promineifilaceae bacterium]|nr:alpha/beta hydrolase [Candidatus Promineifilaceae bacterium]